MNRLGLIGGSLIGGTSWVSSEHYYRASNSGVAERLGGFAARGVRTLLPTRDEQGMLLQDGDAGIPLLDTTQIHCRALIDFMTEGSPR